MNATPGATITAYLTNAPQDLEGTITVAVRALPSETALVAATTSGIAETQLGDNTSNYTATITIPADTAAGDYEIVWANDTTEVTEPLTITYLGAATGNLYATSAELKATLELTGATFADPDIALALEAASRGIDRLCGRRFYPDPDANQTRYYTPEHPGLLRIDDLITLTSLATDPASDGTFADTWTLDTDFVLAPLNAQADGEPWTEIHVRRTGSYRWACGAGRSVRVTGRFGWAAVPVGVKQATVIVASKLMRRAREAPFGVIAVGLESGGAMRIARSDPDVMFLVGDLIRTRVAVA